MSSGISLKPKVLAVDDKRANLIALEAVLGRDYDVILANSGEEAIAYLDQHPDVDVILMDLQMPKMDGFQAAAIIKARPRLRDIPLIFITAIYNEDPFVKRGYQAGAIDYFSKPFDPEILKLKVGVYAAFRRQHAILKERERQIRESEEVLRAAKEIYSNLDQLSVGAIIADVEGRICQTNEEALRILRCSEAVSADAYGQLLRWWEAAGQMLRAQDGALQRALHSGVATRRELITLESLDGSAKSLYTSTSPLFATDGSVVGAVIMLQDPSDRLRVQEEFELEDDRLHSRGDAAEQSRDF